MARGEEQNPKIYEHQTVPIESIVVDFAFNVQPERSQDPELVGGMMEDIADKGLLEPLVVNRVDERLKTPDAKGNLFAIRYYLIAGFIRFEALRRLGWKQIPVTIKRDLDEIEALAVNGAENSRRKQVHPFFWAQRFKFFRDKHGLTCQRIARMHGYSESYVSNLISSYESAPEDIRIKAFKNASIDEIPPPVAWFMSMKGKAPEEYRKAYELKYGRDRDLSQLEDVEAGGDPEVKTREPKRPRMRNRDDIIRFRHEQLRKEVDLRIAIKGFSRDDAVVDARLRTVLKATLDWLIDSKKPFPFFIVKKAPEEELTPEDGEG